MSNTRPFKLTMHRARQLQRGEVMRPGVMLGSHALNEMESLACRLDAACKDCGHNVCSCARIESPPPHGSVVFDEWSRFVTEETARALLGRPAPTAERGVRVGVGDTYRSCWGTGVVECVDRREAIVRRGDGAQGIMILNDAGAPEYEWERISRAEPAQVDDEEPRVGDVYLISGHNWTAERIDGERLILRTEHGDTGWAMACEWRENVAKRVARGPAP